MKQVAKVRYMFGGQLHCSLVLRLRREACPEKRRAHTPNLEAW